MRQTKYHGVSLSSTQMLVALAIALTLGAVAAIARGPDQASAKAVSILGINPDVCTNLTAASWNRDSNRDLSVNAADAVYACNRLNNPAMLADLAGVLGGAVDNPHTYASLSNASGNRLDRNTGKLWILAFVTNHDYVNFNADAGSFASSGAAATQCGPMGNFMETDCDDSNQTQGDGIVVDELLGAASLGGHEVVVFQSGINTVYNFEVVQPPAVGGIVDLPDAATGAAEAGAAESDSSRALYLAIAGAAAAVVAAAAALHARKRRGGY